MYQNKAFYRQLGRILKTASILSLPLLYSPLFGACTDPLVFGVIGDFGYAGPNEEGVADVLKSWNPDLVITVGDNNYPSGSAATIDANIGQYYQSFIGSYTGSYGPGAATNKFFPSPGNHDWDTNDSLQSTYDYFDLPGNERYYDFVEGPVHFFAIDSDTREPDGTSATSTQGVWLQNALAASTAEWKIVYFHHAPYSSSSSHGSTTYMQWPFEAWGADVVMAGHDHLYERLQVGNIPYFINGAGGRSLYGFDSPLPESVVRYSSNYGAMRVEACDDTINFQFITQTGALIDDFTIDKNATPTPTPTPDPNLHTTSFQNGLYPSASYSGTIDTTIERDSRDANHGSETELWVDGDDPVDSGRDASILLKWDLSSIPTDAVIQSATITFDVINDSDEENYQFFQLKRDWDESRATWRNYKNRTRWETDGALGSNDRNTTVLGVVGTYSTGSLDIPLNSDGLALVQSWVDTSTSNNGLVISNTDNSDGLDVSSSEASTPADRPKLTLTYTSVTLGTPTPTPTPTPPPTPTPVPDQICYSIADDGNQLVSIDSNGVFVDIGDVGVSNIESMAFAIGGQTLYAVDADTLGTMNLSTGTFTAVSANTVGTGNGSAGDNIDLDDIDGLITDPLTGTLYGTHRRSSLVDLLIQIDPASGQVVKGAFAGNDYVTLPAISGLVDMDDIAVDPYDGQMYGIVNDGGTDDRLVKINKQTGATSDVGPTNIGDIEGLGFHNSGDLHGTTGNNSDAQDNAVYLIDKTTGNATLGFAFPDHGDYEALCCLTKAANVISGVVFADYDEDGTNDPSEVGVRQITVNLYRDFNANGVVDAEDFIVNSKITGNDGSYEFELGAKDGFIVVIDDSSFGITPIYTSPSVIAHNFADYGESSSADTGVVPMTMEKSDGLLWADITDTGNINPGDVVAFEVVIANRLPAQSLSADLYDPLPAGLEDLDLLATAGGEPFISSSLSLSVTNIDVSSESTSTVIFTATISEDAADGSTITNTAQIDVGSTGTFELTDDGIVGPITNQALVQTQTDVCNTAYFVNNEAGNGYGAFAGENVPASESQLFNPTQACLDQDDNLFIADYSNHVIRRIDNVTGIITTIAGIPHSRGFTGDGGPAIAAELALPADVFVRGTNLYIADKGNNAVRKVDLLTGIITTIAGDGTPGYSGDGGPADAAQLNLPESVYVDVAGNIIIADTHNFAIRKVDAATGLIETIAGNGTAGHAIEGELAVNAQLEWIVDIVANGDGVLYYSEQNGFNLIRKIENDRIYTVTGQEGRDSVGDCGPAHLALLYKPAGLAFDTFDNLYIADEFNHKIRMIDAKTNIITTIAGTGVPGDNGPGLLGIETQLNNPTGVAIGSDGILHIVDRDNHRVRTLDTLSPSQASIEGFSESLSSGEIITIAGTGSGGFNGDGPDALLQKLSYPGGLDISIDGTLVFADRSNHRIRRLTSNLNIVTVAGNGARGFAGDGAAATDASLNFPTDVEVDAGGIIYFSDQYNHVVRAIAIDGTISTIAGTAGVSGSAVGEFNRPDGLTLYNNVLYVSDQRNNRIQAINLSTLAVSVVAGSEGLYSPRGLEADGAGTLFVADLGHHQIVAISAGVANVFAGTGLTGLVGDGGDALSARLTQPMDVAIDSQGNLFIADYRNHAIRKVDQTGTISSYAGTGLSGYTGDGAMAVDATLNRPWGLAVDSNDNVIFSDRLNQAIRAIAP